jgi:CRISPR/Cas system-associated exonuclease Cas4 (RecB family)
MKLSVSALNMFFRCGMQYYFRHVCGISIPPGWSLVVGGSVHKAAQQDLNSKLHYQVLLPLAEIEAAARDAVLKRWGEEGVLLDGEYKAMGEKAAQAEGIDTSVRLARLYHLAVAPQLQPTRVERYWRLDVAGADLTLTGIIDVQEGTATARELKTAKKAPPPSEADDSLQLSLYALVIEKIDGVLPERVWMDYLVHTKVEQVIQLESRRVPEDFGHLLNRIAAARDAIIKGVFTPAPMDAWCCSKKYCGWWARCPYARRPMSVSVSN